MNCVREKCPHFLKYDFELNKDYCIFRSFKIDKGIDVACRAEEGLEIAYNLAETTQKVIENVKKHQ